MNAIKNMSKLMRGVLALVLAAGMLSAAQAAETVEYIHTDALGSPVAVTDANGVVIERTVYEPYGAVVGGQVKDGPGYTGHVSDSATGLTYMQQRYMDPEVGAFLSIDPVSAQQEPVQQFNRYRYANDNPYRFNDPDGRSATVALPWVIVPVIIATTYYVTRTPEQKEALGRFVGDAVKNLTQRSEGGESSETPQDADPNGPFTTTIKGRASKGSDGASSQHELERDSQGRLVSKTHTVKSEGGEVVHGHTDHVGQNGSVRRFSDDLTGKSTIGEGRQEPGLKDQPVKFPPERVMGGRY